MPTSISRRAVLHTCALPFSHGGKKKDVRSSVDSMLFLGGSSDESRYLGSFDESPGDWCSYPSRTQEAKESPTHRKVPARFKTRGLAFDGWDVSLLRLPTPIDFSSSAKRLPGFFCLNLPLGRLCECSRTSRLQLQPWMKSSKYATQAVNPQEGHSRRASCI
jgi:hypothetical protein